MEGHILVVLFSLVCVSSSAERGQTEMPLSYFRTSGLAAGMQNKTKFVDDFYKNFDLTGVDENIPFVARDNSTKYIGSSSIKEFERSDLATTVNHAGCDPYDQIVTIPNDRTNVLLYPSCVVLKQCGGCCGHPSLACKPTAKKEKIIQLLKYTYDGSQAHPVEKVDYASMEEHTACQCQCKLTEEDCDKTLHYFDDWDCKCMCRNGRQNCGSNKRWDENLCACRCSSVQNCGTGYTYNMVTCRCEENAERSGGPGGKTPEVAQPDVVKEDVVTPKNICGHLNCRKYYRPTPMDRGGCACKFSREDYLNRNS